MIYVLSLLACLTGQPDRCERVEFEVQSCNAGGQALVAIWSERHPRHIVKSWVCETGKVA